MAENRDVDKEFNSRLIELQPLNHSGRWSVEVPQQLTTFEEILKVALPEALSEVDGRLRQMDATIHFVPNLILKEGAKGRGVFAALGSASYSTGQHRMDIVMALPKKLTKNPVRSSIIAQSVLHEIYEVDYHLKTLLMGQDINRATLGDPEYSNAEHEVVATQKAISCLQRTIGLGVKNPEVFGTKNYWEKLVLNTPPLYTDR